MIMDAVEEIRSWGHPEGKPLIIKSVIEHAMVTVRVAITSWVGAWQPQRSQPKENPSPMERWKMLAKTSGRS